MPDLSDTVAKCRMGTAKKFYTSIASLSHLSKELRDVSCVFTEPCLLPSAGGIILACRAAGNEVSEQMIENLRTAQHMRV